MDREGVRDNQQKDLARRASAGNAAALEALRKRSATIEVIDERENVLAAGRFATGQGRRSDPVDAHSVAVAALHAKGSRQLTADDATARAAAAGRPPRRTRTISRRPALPRELIGGGAKKYLSAAQARALLSTDIVDISRFAGRGHFASCNGTAPLDASSGDHTRHRLSRAGNRRINAGAAHHGRRPTAPRHRRPPLLPAQTRRR